MGEVAVAQHEVDAHRETMQRDHHLDTERACRVGGAMRLFLAVSSATAEALTVQ